MFIEPNSTVVLMKGVPLDPTYENTLCWDFQQGLASQSWYFFENTAIERITLTNYSYLRKERGVIKVEYPIEAIYNVNYMAFRNNSFENKWFYAFVTQVDYINNVTCLVHYEIDLIQTWFFFLDFNPCFIDRQHSITDGIGDNIVDEGFNVGDYVVWRDRKINFTPVVVMAVTEIWVSTLDPPKFVAINGNVTPGRNSNGEYSSGLYYHGCGFLVYNIQSANDAETQRLNDDIARYTDKNKINAIVSLFIAPREIFSPDPDHNIVFHTEYESVKTYFQGILGYYLDRGMHPKNNKLMTYPYNFLQVSNYQGDAVDYRYEFFNNQDRIEFEMWGNATPNPGVVMYPKNYKGLEENWEEIVVNQCYPACSFNDDTYKAWLAQNKGTLAAGALSSVAAIASGLTYSPGTPSIPFNNMGKQETLAGSPGSVGFEVGGGVLGGLAGIAGMIGRAYDKSTLPRTQHGSGNGDLMYQAGLGGFSIYHKCIPYDMAKRIDDYFTMYGYKQNIHSIPVIQARRAFTYVKTIDCSLKGDIPCDDSRAIEAIFNKGIRFWMYNKTFGDYTQDNSPLGV